MMQSRGSQRVGHNLSEVQEESIQSIYEIKVGRSETLTYHEAHPKRTLFHPILVPLLVEQNKNEIKKYST